MPQACTSAIYVTMTHGLPAAHEAAHANQLIAEKASKWLDDSGPDQAANHHFEIGWLGRNR